MKNRNLPPHAICGAEFSACEKYRYALWRSWRPGAKSIAFIGLNPSTADALKNDNTVNRCINYAMAWGFGKMFMLNAYGYRSTNPKAIKTILDPVGPGNDDAIRDVAGRVDKLILCWGGNIEASRHEQVLALLSSIKTRAYHLGLNADGTPKHPLYLKGSAEPVKWKV